MNSTSFFARSRTLAITTPILGLAMFSTHVYGYDKNDLGGFLGVQAGYVDSSQIEDNGTAFKISIGPNITEKLALEFNFSDFGESVYKEPLIAFNGENAPSISNFDNGEVDRENATENELAKTTYNGTPSFTTQAISMGLRYSHPISTKWSLFGRLSASAWVAQLEQVEIVALSDQSISFTPKTEREVSGVSRNIGIGTLWDISSNWSIRAEFEQVELSSRKLNETNYEIFSLGAQYSF